MLTKERAVFLFILGMTLVNVAISVYLLAESVGLMRRHCTCATSGVFWYGVLLYIFASFAFVGYNLLMLLGYVEPGSAQTVLFSYLIGTVFFVFISLRYLKQVGSAECDCIRQRYRKFLSMMILVRYLFVLALGLGVVAWAAYNYFVKK